MEEPLEELVGKLRQLGFNGNEAKVYLSLLSQHPATGYEVSQSSGVPQAKVYEILRSLETNQVVVAMGQKPATYVPISPEELLDRCERSFRNNVSHLREVLPAMSDGTVDPVINLRGDASLYRHALDMIGHATSTIYLEVWRQDMPHLKVALEAARARGVAVRIVGYGGVECEAAMVYRHGSGELIEASLGGRWIILAVDEAEGMVATVSSGNMSETETARPSPRQSHGVYTRNTGLVLIIQMLVVHDLFILDMENELGPELTARYGPGMLKLRQKILGPHATLGHH